MIHTEKNTHPAIIAIPHASLLDLISFLNIVSAGFVLSQLLESLNNWTKSL